MDLRLQTCSDMYSDINKEKLTDTVNGCEILHQLIGGLSVYPIIYRPSTILSVVQDFATTWY